MAAVERHDPESDIAAALAGIRTRLDTLASITAENILTAHLPTSKFHAIRHTFAVGMLRSGAPLTDVADHLGHTDIKITRLYARELTGDENKYGAALVNRFGIKRRSARC